MTVIPGASAPSDTETTEVSPLPRREARAPGAALTLPANPLSDLDAADLASFIEHTLLESTAQADQAQTRAAPPASAARARDRMAGARRTARRAAPYASCLLVGVVFGFAVRPGAKPAPLVAAPTVAPAPATVPPPAPERRKTSRRSSRRATAWRA